MGNTIGKGKRTKVMTLDGQTDKFKTPIRAYDVTKNRPDHVLLESASVRRYGIRAKPLEPQQGLKSNKVYFLVVIPSLPRDDDRRCRRAPKRTRSVAAVCDDRGTNAQERLERLMQSRGRSLCDRVETGRNRNGVVLSDSVRESGCDGPVRVKMRIPRAHVVKLVEESRDEVEVAEKIIDLYMEHNTCGGDGGDGGGGARRGGGRRVSAEVSGGLWLDYGKGPRRPNFRSAVTECVM